MWKTRMIIIITNIFIITIRWCWQQGTCSSRRWRCRTSCSARSACLSLLSTSSPTIGPSARTWFGIEWSSRKWPRLQAILCKLIGAIQSTCVFFSSFSILLIACDRYFFIVHPTGSQISIKQVTTITCFKMMLFLSDLDQTDNNKNMSQNDVISIRSRSNRQQQHD